MKKHSTAAAIHIISGILIKRSASGHAKATRVQVTSIQIKNVMRIRKSDSTAVVKLLISGILTNANA